MADIALLTAGRIEIFEVDTGTQKTLTAAVALEAGQLVHIDANGDWALAAGGAAGTATNVYMCTRKVAAGQNVTGIKKGKVDGFVLDALAFNAAVFLSNTAGAFGDVAGTVSVIAGRVIPGMAQAGATEPDKILQLDLPL